MSSPWRLLVLLLEELAVPGVAVHGVGEGLLESLLVHAALDGADAVGEGVEAVGVVPGVPLERDLDVHRVVAGLLVLVQVADLGEQRLLGPVHVPDEVTDAALVAVVDRVVGCPSRWSWKVMRRPALRNAIIWNRSVRVAARNTISSKTVGIGPEADGGSGAELAVVAHRGLADHDQAARRARRRPRRPCGAVSPSRSISTSTRRESAFTTEMPTPCRPPDTL